MSKYTPGPWVIAPEFLQINDHRIAIWSKSVDTIVAEVVTEDAIEGTAEELADANLIAAAPDILEALEMIIKASDSGNNGAAIGEAVVCEYLATIAKQAIGRAKGE